MDPLSSNISTIFKVTADDYGYCLKRNNGIIESVENGIVNSVSVLVNGSCVEPIALQNCQKRVLIGLHLNLTEGNPITTPAEIPTLLQSNRRFYPKLEFYHRLNDNKVLSTEVRRCLFLNSNGSARARIVVILRSRSSCRSTSTKIINRESSKLKVVRSLVQWPLSIAKLIWLWMASRFVFVLCADRYTTLCAD